MKILGATTRMKRPWAKVSTVTMMALTESKFQLLSRPRKILSSAKNGFGIEGDENDGCSGLEGYRWLKYNFVFAMFF